MRIKWLRKALENLDAEVACVAADNPQAAADMYVEVMARVGMLPDVPAAGRPGRVPGTREWVVERFPLPIPYRVMDAEGHILRMLHTRRRVPSA